MEEKVTFRKILEIDSRGVALRLSGVKDRAKFILETRGRRCGGTLWDCRVVLYNHNQI
jgi:hypothetical protein